MGEKEGAGPPVQEESTSTLPPTALKGVGQSAFLKRDLRQKALAPAFLPWESNYRHYGLI